MLGLRMSWWHRLRVAVLGAKVQTKIMAATAGMILLVTAATSYVIYRVALREVTEQFGQKLMAVAASGAMDVDGDAFASLTGPEHVDTDAYRAVQARLRRLRDANRHIRMRFVYTMAPTERPGVWRYVVDSLDPGDESFSPPGSTEDFTYDPRWLGPVEQPFAEDQVRFYPGWGHMVSASAPVRDRQGRSVGVLCIDARAETILATTRTLRARAAAFSAAGLLLALLVSLLVSRQITAPIQGLIAGTRAIARGDFGVRMNIPNRDELGYMAHAFNVMAEGLQERELYKKQFERYVSRQVADKILSDPEKAFWDAERREVTILFSDIRGFTAMAERTPPEVVIARLNEYLSLMIDVVFEHEGTLDKFIGDAVMTLFGAPIHQADHAERAVRAALAMQREAEALGRKWVDQGFSRLDIGIGINTGEVVVGNIGSERRMEYSAIGDAVNLASRLESLNKEFKSRILVSESTYRAVAHAVEARFVERVAVRGREKPVEIYEVLGLKNPSSPR
jgi:adenylate cyclase